MGKKLTFRQYLDSKDRLREAVKNVPQRKVEYSVKKYCKLVVGESKDDKQYINLKPKNKIVVEWKYNCTDNPTCINIFFEDVKDVNPDDSHKSMWEGERLLRWLERNAKEQR